MCIQNPLYGKIFIEGEIKCVTGLHIGASQQVNVGPVDAAVVRDPITQEPYLPGSSLRGRLRALFERKMHGQDHQTYKYESMGQDVHLHVCNEPDCPICRLFGAVAPADTQEQWNRPSPLKIPDLPMKDAEAFNKKLRSPLLYTEWKAENALDRVTAHSNPRDIERVPKGAKFELSLIYDVTNPANIKADLENLAGLLCLLEDDALGGHSSRGYGRVKVRLCQIQCKKISFYEKPKCEAIKDKSSYCEYKKVSCIDKFRAIIDEISKFFTQ